MLYIVLGILICLLGVFNLIAVIFEKRDFNKGYCPHCNKRLRRFDTDSQGGRGYNCDCGYHTWISYNCVDKNFNNIKR